MADKRPADIRDYLHDPDREMDEPEVHVSKARQLSRALYMAISANSEEFPMEEPRNRDAIEALISEVAFHASAAEYQHAIETEPNVEQLLKGAA